MRLAVTGASGRVGSAFVREARNEGHELVLLGRRFPRAVEQEVECHVVDLDYPVANPDLPRALEGVVAAVHLAAHIDTEPADDDAAISMFRTNVLGTGHLIDLLAKSKVPHLVVASSANVYDPRVPTADETTATRPLSRTLYLSSKIAQESLARELCQKSGIGCAVVRISSVVETGMDIISKFANMIADDREIVLFGTAYGADFISARDVAKGLLLATEKSCEGDFNLSTGTRLTLQQVISMIGTALGKAPLLRIIEQSDNQDAGFPAIDCGRLRACGFAPEPLEHVIDRICAAPRADRETVSGGLLK